MTIIEDNKSVMMHRPTLAGLPEHGLPGDLTFRMYRPGDEHHWLAIQQDAETHLNITMETFERQFGLDPGPLSQRMCFLADSSGTPVATASAWVDDHFNDPAYGRIHWVAMMTRMQGRGLAKVLMSLACRRMVELGHRHAYLITSTARVAAINLYLQFGFRPLYRSGEDRQAWQALRQQLKYQW